MVYTIKRSYFMKDENCSILKHVIVLMVCVYIVYSTIVYISVYSTDNLYTKDTVLTVCTMKCDSGCIRNLTV